MPALAVLLVCLATFRASRLLAVDAFPPVAAVRDRIEDRWGDASWQAYLSTCVWCCSAWVGGLIVVATLFALDDGLPAPALVWAAASAGSGILATILDAVEGE